jgi:hypothetical protein
LPVSGFYAREPKQPNRFRIGLLGFSLLLGAHALWVFTAELIRPPSRSFPAAIGSAPNTQRQLDDAATAARIGFIRGDLWADDAIRLANDLKDGLTGSGAVHAPGPLTGVRSAGEHAIRLAPHDGRIWLLLAAVDLRLGLPSGPSLTMSYYTAASDESLMPLRLLIAARSGALADADLQILVAAEIRTIERERPDLKPAIVTAYRDANAPGRQFLEEAIGTFDPDLLAAMRVSVEPR